MGAAGSTLRVFVSSTSEDLKVYREVAKEVILDLTWHPIMMEHFGASAQGTVEACRGELQTCDVMLLLVAWRRGWVPNEEQGGNGTDSITALELQCAKELGVPVLPLLATDTWPMKLCEDEEDARKYIKSFRSTLNQPADFFEFEKLTTDGEALPAFRAKVKQALLTHKEKRLQAKGGGVEGAAGVDYFESARDGLLDAADVPFLGPRIYGEGPLSPAALAHALIGSGDVAQDRSLATAAEYRWRYLDSRERFLAHFRKILLEQSADVQPLPVHDLFVHGTSHQLLVSTSWDMILETRLREAGRAFTIVSHVMSSWDNEHDGKVVLFPPDGDPQFMAADAMTLDKDEVYVYKPVGSPFLNDRFDEDDEVDTVVVTETDHATLVHRLAHQSTGIPTGIGRRLARKPLLFLGYGLDVWQFRLMMFVYHLAWRFKKRRAPIIAVRAPESLIEEVAWKRLSADLVRMEPNAFATQVMAAN